MEGRFSCLLDSAKEDRILAHFSFSRSAALDNLTAATEDSTTENAGLGFDDSPNENFDPIRYLVSVLNISDKKAEDLLNGDVSCITHAPKYEIDITYVARYDTGTILSGISKNCPLLISINELINSGNLKITDLSKSLIVKFNPEFTTTLMHISARHKRKLRFKEINMLVCTITLSHQDYNTEIAYEYYLPKSFKGTVLEYNKNLEIDATNLYLRPLDKGWIILGLDTSKESGVYGR